MVHFSTQILPKHILLKIFGHLDHRSIDRLSLVSREFDAFIARNRPHLCARPAKKFEFTIFCGDGHDVGFRRIGEHGELRMWKDFNMQLDDESNAYGRNDESNGTMDDASDGDDSDDESNGDDEWDHESDDDAPKQFNFLKPSTPMRLINHFNCKCLSVSQSQGEPTLKAILKFLERFLAENMRRSSLIEQVDFVCNFANVNLDEWLSFLTTLTKCVRDLHEFSLFNNPTPSADFLFPAMLASGLIYKVRHYDEREEREYAYFGLSPVCNRGLQRDHAGFLRQFFVDRVEDYHWSDGSECAAHILLRIAAFDLTSEHLLQLFQAWLRSPIPICKHPRMVRYSFKANKRGTLAALFSALTAQEAYRSTTDNDGDECILVKHPSSQSHYLAITLRPYKQRKYLAREERLEILRAHSSIKIPDELLFCDD